MEALKITAHNPIRIALSFNSKEFSIYREEDFNSYCSHFITEIELIDGTFLSNSFIVTDKSIKEESNPEEYINGRINKALQAAVMIIVTSFLLN